MNIPMDWFAGNEIMAPPKGMLAAVEVPAVTTVDVRPNTHPFAVDILGVVWPVTRAPPTRYQTSTSPEVPETPLKTLVIPVKKMG